MAGCALAAPAEAAGRLADGVYSNVCLYPETDDIGGFEVSLHHLGRHPQVGIVICEGGCWRGVVSSVARSKDGLSFTVTEELLDQNGHPATPAISHYRVRAQGRSLILSSSDFGDFRRAALRPWTRTPKGGGADAVAPSDKEPTPAPVGRCR